VIYNPQVVQDFRSFQDKIKRRQEENPALFLSQDWKLTDDMVRREEVMESYQKYVKSMSREGGRRREEGEEGEEGEGGRRQEENPALFLSRIGS
jgi:hypothetical protein